MTWQALPPAPSSEAGQEPAYQLLFNRDERLTRAAELPPRIQAAENGVQYIAPEDSEAGGTWITANEHGVTVALLNGYTQSRGPGRSSYTSRGLLVRGLAGIQAPKEALEQLSPKRLSEFQPAVVLVKSPSAPALIVRWDGREAAIDVDGERQLPLTSSVYEQDDVQRAREQLYRELVEAPGPESHPLQPGPARLAAFHSYVDPLLGPTPLTPSMQHANSATRSQCAITVTGQGVSFAYRPGPPHKTEVSETLELQRIGGSLR